MSDASTILLAILLASAGCGAQSTPSESNASPIVTPVTSTTPANSATVQVPTKLAIKRTADSLAVSIDQARETITLVLDEQLIAGVKHTIRVHPAGATATADRGGGLSGGTGFNLGERIFNRAQDGFPIPNTRYVVEIDLELFETDVPTGHMWSPESGFYRVRWRRTLTQTVE